MIGRKRIPVIALAISLSLTAPVFANCSQFEAEAEAIEGVVPKLNDDGSIRAFVMYGEGTFIAAKRSLITQARRKAELRAKRAFSEWMEQNLQSETLTSDMLETVEETDSNGMSAGTATEISQAIDVMRTSTEAVLSGIIKLDECVDSNQKFVLVEMGWKPSLSAAAADTKSTINREVARGNENAPASASQNARSTAPSKSQIQPAEGYRKKSTLKDAF